MLSYFISFIGFIIAPRVLALFFWFQGMDHFCLSSMNIVILTGILSTNIIHALSLYLICQQKHNAILKHLSMLMPLLPVTADIVSCFGFRSDCQDNTKYFWLITASIGLLLHLCHSVAVVSFSLIGTSTVFATKTTISEIDVELLAFTVVDNDDPDKHSGEEL